MANYNLTAQQIKDTFGQLAQVSASIEGGVAGSGVLDGTGSRVTTLHATASNALNSVSSSFASTATSASFADNATSASYAPNTGVTSIIAGTNVTIDQPTGAVTISATGGGSVDTGSLLVTASNVDAVITYTKGDGSVFTNTINNVAFSTEAEDLVITVKNTSGVTLTKGTAVHAVGVTGQNVDVIAASNDSAATMPAIGLLSQEIANNASGTCIIQGRETGINTTGLSAGDPVYVHTAGALTATKPTGSALIQNIGTAAKIDGTDGEIIIQGSGRVNDLPNVAEGAVWVGNSDHVPTAVQTGSLSVASASMADDLISTANININSITASNASFVSASIGYLESITGSAKIIGDAFIILNNDTPTQRYAGIKVIDSGSTAATASLQFDGNTNDWFYEYTSSADPDNFGVVMFGPEYNTIGSPTYIANNTIPKADGGHHLNDSNITDDGSTVKINSNTQITGSFNLNGAIDATGNITGNNITANGYLYSVAGAVTSGTGVQAGYGGSSGTFKIDGSTSQGLAFPTYDAFVNSTNNTNMFSAYRIQDRNATGSMFAQPISLEMSTFTGRDGVYPVTQFRMGPAESGSANNTIIWSSENYPKANFEKSVQFNKSVSLSSSLAVEGTTSLTGSLTLTGSLDVLGDTDINGILSLPGITNVSASIVAAENVAAFPFTGNAQITGSLIVTGSQTLTGSLAIDGQVTGGVTSLAIASTTASMDFNDGNFFNLTLANGVDTHLDATNVAAGQTITLTVTNNATGAGTLSFSPDFKFAGGTAPTVTAAVDAVDILTFVTTDATDVYGTGLLNFS